MEDKATIQRGSSCLLSLTAMGRSRARGWLGHWGTEWLCFPPGEKKQEKDSRVTPSLAQQDEAKMAQGHSIPLSHFKLQPQKLSHQERWS